MKRSVYSFFAHEKRKKWEEGRTFIHRNESDVMKGKMVPGLPRHMFSFHSCIHEKKNMKKKGKERGKRVCAVQSLRLVTVVPPMSAIRAITESIGTSMPTAFTGNITPPMGAGRVRMTFGESSFWYRFAHT